MKAAQSQFSRFPKKHLVFIAEKLIDDEFPIGNPYDADYDYARKILKEVGNYFNVAVVDEDVEFFSKFLEINGDIIAELFANNGKLKNNKQLIDRLEIPVAKTYDVHYTVWGSCSYTEYMAQYFDCYDENWVKDSAVQQRNDGSWDWWDGRNVKQTDYDNFQENDWSIDDVYEYEEKENAKESILDRLVVENTQEIVDSLDKKTLLELKNIIDLKLRLL